MQDSIRTGMLSYGTSGQYFHAPFLEAHPGFNLVGVVERSQKKAHLRFPEIKSFTSVDEMISDSEIELIIINTPNYTHFDYALKAIRAGKHVLVEKPFTVTSGEAELLFKEAKQNNRYILPYQNRRYDSDFLSVKNIVDSKKLGKLVEVHFRFDRYRYSIGPKAAKETAVPGSGLLYDLGPHLVDMIIFLFGEPAKWTKTLGYFRPDTQVNDYAYIHLKYPGQLQVFITMSMLVADVQPAFILNGTLGSFTKRRSNIQEEQLMKNMSPLDPLYGIEPDGNEGLVTYFNEAGDRVQENVKSSKSSYLDLFEEIYLTLRRGKAYPITEQEILQQINILE